ncbi:predicted protein [Uncinocarpus reesii 1704]|uniref:F-box domain-containing protein n=1 Tax=Uncinocarpus reesii (strain UAMH 1704) TaxID=336963 RepID=C4JPH2_UNCRE|nr:uncharacterized protein UREG_03144 [Uncinocarpus reesii 1704]EEP78298.1 predicted protein [Uncinocarpus reesii 1704]
MKQSTLDRFGVILEQRPHTGLTFLDLPFNVRCRVYEHVGLYRTCPIDLNYEPTKGYDAEDVLDHDEEHDKYADVDPKYQCYVRKYFDFCDYLPGLVKRLLALHNLSPETLSHITTLAIRINFCVKHPHGCPYRYNLRPIPKTRPLQRIISRHEKWMLADWTCLCMRLAQYIQPGRLRLSFICDTENIETAKAFLAPLQAIPTLARCGIRLSRKEKPELQRLADETVAHLSTPRVAPFRFSVLPTELQARILAHTDLVAPHAIEWSPSAGYEPWQPMLQPEKCYMCIDVRESCCTPLEEGSFASRCDCWKPPKALFYLNYRTREEALRIFFKENHIILHYNTGPRLDLVPFLLSIPRQARKYLRSIQFEFPDPRCMTPGSKVSQDLAAAVTILVADADLRRLTITIDVSAGWHSGEDFEVDESLNEIRWFNYKQMILPMYLFGGRLKDFFVHLPWFYLSYDLARRREQEQDLERRIMGSAEYDSIQRGKFKRPCTAPISQLSAFIALSQATADFTLDANEDLERLCPLDAGRRHANPVHDLGQLEQLPLELLNMVLLGLDLRSLMDFRRVNQRAMEVVGSIPQYATILMHAKNALRGIISIGSARWISCLDIYQELRRAECDCGDFGGYLYLFTCRRVCFLCFTSESAYLPIGRGHAMRKFGLQGAQVAALPAMKSVPGFYSGRLLKCRTRHNLVDYESARQAGIKLHGSVAEMERHCSEMELQRREQYLQRKSEFKSGGGRAPRRPPLVEPFDGRQSNPRRYMAIVPAPYITTGKVIEWGFHCEGCRKHNYSRPLHWRRKFTVASFEAHLRECGNIVAGKHI